jgi:phospholipid transport system substrate-binding protein
LSRSRRGIACLLALLVAQLTLATTAFGLELNAPQQVIQDVSDRLMRVLRDDRELLHTDPDYVHRLVERLFLPNVDFGRISALVLGPHWREATPSQRQAFEQEFKRLLIQTYASALDRLSGWELSYPPMQIEPSQTKALVKTEMRKPGGNPVAVDYRMVVKDDRWVAYDVMVEGVSLLATYRAQFSEIARRRGLDGLLAELHARNGTKR